MADAKSIEPQESALTRAWNWLTETQVWASVFRHGAPINDRNRVLVMLSNIFYIYIPLDSRNMASAFGIPGVWADLAFFCFSY